jgi:hypothetical protein
MSFFPFFVKENISQKRKVGRTGIPHEENSHVESARTLLFGVYLDFELWRLRLSIRTLS